MPPFWPAPRSGFARRHHRPRRSTYQRLLNACSRAAELADADGQLRQLELLDAERHQPRQRRQSQGQVHGLARRPQPSEQGHRVFHAAGRRRLHVCRQPVAAVLEVRRARRKADRGVEVRRQGAGRRQERPQRRAARQQRLLQHRQRQPESAPRRARQEFRAGGVRRHHHDARSAAQPGTLGGAARGQEHDHRRPGEPRRERPRLSSPPMRPTPASCCGASSSCPIPASPAPRPGPIRAPSRPAAAASGPSRPSIRRPISSMSAPPTRCTCSIRRAVPGDNLYTNSIIALDVDTGKLKWYFQTVPNESWDYDAVAITQLYDVNIGGEMRKVIGADQPQRLLLHARPHQRPVPPAASRSPR